MVDDDAPTASRDPTDGAGRSPAEAHCPHCGAAAERGQLVCLECGSRIALTYRRPPSWKVPVAICAAVVALFVIGAVVAVAAIGNDAKREVAAAPPRPQSPAKATRQRAPAKRESAGAAGRGDSAGPATAIVRRGALYTWPGALTGFTVVINTAQDRSSAMTFAESAARSRVAKVGVIRADDFRGLPKGFYVVFAGYYAAREPADQATARLGKRFPGAFTQSIKR